MDLNEKRDDKINEHMPDSLNLNKHEASTQSWKQRTRDSQNVRKSKWKSLKIDVNDSAERENSKWWSFVCERIVFARMES